jgi:invasion protein IalB
MKMKIKKWIMRLSRALGLGAGVLTVGMLAALAADAPSVAGPAGAAQRETYDDWTVVCSTAPSGKTCAMQQELRTRENNQRVLAIELHPQGMGADGALALPFGLALAKGVTLQIDEGAATAPLAFRTCLPAGCIAPLNVSARMLGALRRGAAMKVTVAPDGGGNALQWPVSLKGFSNAYDRLTALVK